MRRSQWNPVLNQAMTVRRPAGRVFPQQLNAMKYLYIPAALLVSVSGSYAQSSVQLFGVADVAYTHMNATTSISGLTSGESSSSRLGFRGTEDLGGGLRAGFWLEAGLAMDNGTAAALKFDRRSTVSLSGGFGEVRLGRDKLASYLTIESFDPFGDTGVGGNGGSNLLGNAAAAVGTAEGSHPKRVSNSVAYFLPTLGDFSGQLQYSFGETPSGTANSDRGNAIAFQAVYAGGPLNIAFGHGVNDGGTATTKVSYKATNIGASYDFGFIKPMALWATERSNGRRIDLYTLGAVAPIASLHEVRFAFSQFSDKNLADADTQKIALATPTSCPSARRSMQRWPT